MREEIYKKIADDSSVIELCIDDSGAVKLQATDSGLAVEVFWNTDEYLFWVDVPASQLQKLAFALLKERYLDRGQAVDELTVFCKQHDIEHNWASWPSTPKPSKLSFVKG